MYAKCKPIQQTFDFIRYIGPLNLKDLKGFMGSTLVQEKTEKYITKIFYKDGSGKKTEIHHDDVIVKISNNTFFIYSDEEFSKLYVYSPKDLNN